MTVIEIIEKSKEIHQDWLAYFKKHPEAQSLKEHKNIGDIEYHKTCIREYDQAIADIRQIQAENKELRGSLLQHRGDLHCGSIRPCGTCRRSAKILGLNVPNQCAREYWDKRALEGGD